MTVARSADQSAGGYAPERAVAVLPAAVGPDDAYARTAETFPRLSGEDVARNSAVNSG